MTVFFSQCRWGCYLFYSSGGSGALETDFGVMNYTRGDYIVVPKGTTIRFNTSKEDQKYLVIESRAEMNLPEKGLLGKHALFDIGMLESPNPEPVKDSGEKREYELRIKRENEFTKVFYDFNPLDVVGWKGDLTVVKVNIKDFRPVGKSSISCGAFGAFNISWSGLCDLQFCTASF